MIQFFAGFIIGVAVGIFVMAILMVCIEERRSK